MHSVFGHLECPESTGRKPSASLHSCLRCLFTESSLALGEADLRPLYRSEMHVMHIEMDIVVAP